MAASEVESIVQTIMSHLKASSRLHLLPMVVRELEKKTARYIEANTAIVRSAKPLDAASLEDLKTYLSKRFKREVEVTNVVDPHLVAGFVIRVGDTIIDRSVSGKLDALQEQLLFTNRE